MTWSFRRDSFSIRIVEWRALQERYTPFQIAPRRQTFREERNLEHSKSLFFSGERHSYSFGRFQVQWPISGFTRKLWQPPFRRGVRVHCPSFKGVLHHFSVVGPNFYPIYHVVWLGGVVLRESVGRVIHTSRSSLYFLWHLQLESGGTLFSILCGILPLYLGHLTKEASVGFDAVHRLLAFCRTWFRLFPFVLYLIGGETPNGYELIPWCYESNMDLRCRRIVLLCVKARSSSLPYLIETLAGNQTKRANHQQPWERSGWSLESQKRKEVLGLSVGYDLGIIEYVRYSSGAFLGLTRMGFGENGSRLPVYSILIVQEMPEGLLLVQLRTRMPRIVPLYTKSRHAWDFRTRLPMDGNPVPAVMHALFRLRLWKVRFFGEATKARQSISTICPSSMKVSTPVLEGLPRIRDSYNEMPVRSLVTPWLPRPNVQQIRKARGKDPKRISDRLEVPDRKGLQYTDTPGIDRESSLEEVGNLFKESDPIAVGIKVCHPRVSSSFSGLFSIKGSEVSRRRGWDGMQADQADEMEA
ncbi:hypothetical protein Tco_0552907 [Tanacetum coccineum]